MAIGGATSSLPGVHEAQWRRRDRGRRGREHQRPPGTEHRHDPERLAAAAWW